MNKFITILVLIFLFGCNSDKKNVDEKNRLDVFFKKSSDINLDKPLRLKYLDSIVHINEKIKNNYTSHKAVLEKPHRVYKQKSCLENDSISSRP